MPDALADLTWIGMWRYMAERRDISLCDCRVPMQHYDFRANDPPWKGRADGVALSISLDRPEEPDEIVRWIRRGGVPAVSMCGDVFHPQLPVVCTDVESIARLAADHLVDCGCRSFMHAGYRLSMGSRRRAEAFRRVLARRGFELATFDFAARLRDEPDEAVLAADAKLLAPLLQSLPKPLGVLALGDPFARGVLKVCESLGLQVPRQVAIVGVGNLPLAFGRRATLTSIGVPGEEVGHRAIDLLLNLIARGPQPQTPIEIPARQIFCRQSTTGTVEQGDELPRALEMIHRRACAGLTVADLMQSCCVSRSWLQREFQRHLGRSPAEEIQRVRLLRALQLFQATELSVTQIAGMVGFAESSGLTRFFRRLTSSSPVEYRRWFRGLAVSCDRSTQSVGAVAAGGLLEEPQPV